MTLPTLTPAIRTGEFERMLLDDSNTASPGQPKECEAANETYAAGQTVIGNAPGNSGTQTNNGAKNG